MGNKASVSDPPPLSLHESVRRSLQERLYNPSWIAVPLPAHLVDDPSVIRVESKGRSTSNDAVCFRTSRKKEDQSKLHQSDWEYGEMTALYLPAGYDWPPPPIDEEETATTTVGSREASDMTAGYSPKGSSLIRFPVFGRLSNHRSFLNPGAFDRLLPFVIGPSLPKMMAACPHWFLTISNHLHRLTSPLTASFRSTYAPYLDIREITCAVQKLPLHDEDVMSCRVDLLLFARVNSSCVSKCTQLGYSYSYLKDEPLTVYIPSNATSSKKNSPNHMNGMNKISSHRSPVLPPEGMVSDGKILFPQDSSYAVSALARQVVHSSRPNKTDHDAYAYDSVFRFKTSRQGTQRRLWMHKDITRFHGDELLVGCTPGFAHVCVDDIIEIPLVLSNAFGMTDLSSVRWHPIQFLPDTPSAIRDGGVDFCPLEYQNQVWMDFDRYQQTTSERIATLDVFGPQWKLIQSEYTGIDITVSKSIYRAVTTGTVPQSQKILGVTYTIVDAHHPVIVSLKRVGLQHDRYTPQQMRLGDTMVLFMSQGGTVADSLDTISVP